MSEYNEITMSGFEEGDKIEFTLNGKTVKTYKMIDNKLIEVIP